MRRSRACSSQTTVSISWWVAWRMSSIAWMSCGSMTPSVATPSMTKMGKAVARLASEAGRRAALSGSMR
jgi:hypothetical protein